MASDESRRARAADDARGRVEQRGDTLVAEDGEPLSFEAALAELEALVERMEAGELTLEESLAGYERGMRLYGFCQGTLAAAEQKVRVLGTAGERRDGSAADDLEPFDPPTDGEP